jgi:Sigma-70 factor, region 1.1
VEFSEVIRTAIELGRRNGFVTFDQLNALIDGSRSEPEDVEDLMEALRDNGINLREG